MEEKNVASPDWVRITLRMTPHVGRCADCRAEVARVIEGA